MALFDGNIIKFVAIDTDINRLKEAEHKSTMLKNRQDVKRQMDSYKNQPLVVAPTIDKPEKTDPSLDQMVKSYSQQYNAAAEGSRVRARIQEEIGKKKKALLQREATKITKTKVGKKALMWIGRIASDGSVVEWEGGAAWLWSALGIIVWGGRALVTIFKPQSPKILSFLEFDLKDPVTWGVDFPYGIVAILVLGAIFLVVMAIFIMIVAAFLFVGTVLGGIAEFFGFIDLI